MCERLHLGFESNGPWAHRSKWERVRWIAFYNVRQTVEGYMGAGDELEASGITIEDWQGYSHEDREAAMSYKEHAGILKKIKCTLTEWMGYDGAWRAQKLKFAQDAVSKGHV